MKESDTLYSTGMVKPGWMGLGFGQRMGGSDMIIGWLDENQTTILSPRRGHGHFAPTLTPPDREFILRDSQTYPLGIHNFTIETQFSGLKHEAIIFAMGSNRPSSSDPSASIGIHVAHHAAFLDFTSKDEHARITTRGLSVRERIILAHAILSTVGFLVLLPAGSLIVRYFRTTKPGWFNAHWVAQFGIGAPVIFGGADLGISAMILGKGIHFDDPHKRIGLALIALYIAQCSFGQLIHWYRQRAQWTTRPIWNYFHPVVGLTIIGLGFYQARLGFMHEWVKVTGRPPVPPIVDMIWYIWAFLLPTLYILGLSLLPRQFKIEAYRRYTFEHEVHQGERQPLLNPADPFLTYNEEDSPDDITPRASVSHTREPTVADA